MAVMGVTFSHYVFLLEIMRITYSQNIIIIIITHHHHHHHHRKYHILSANYVQALYHMLSIVI